MSILLIITLYFMTFNFKTHYEFKGNCSKQTTKQYRIKCVYECLTVNHIEYTDGYKSTTGQCGAVCT